MKREIHTEGEFKYIEIGEGEPLLLLHGLFGALSNFEGIINHFSKNYKVTVPLLPIFDLPLREVSLLGMVEYIKSFVRIKGYERVHVLGNSLGGHLALLYALDCPENIRSITLTGSSGLFESAFGSTFPKRGDYDYIKTKTEGVFYNSEMASKALVDEVFDMVNDRNKAIRLVVTAKSAIRNNLRGKLHEIKVPTLLVWGKQDEVTPPFVGEEFNKRIANSTLIWIDKCGHAPMMEEPEQFNQALEDFLKNISK